MKNLFISWALLYALILFGCASPNDTSISKDRDLSVNAEETTVVANLKLVNTTPYLLNVAYSYPTGSGESITVGWWNLQPGDSISRSEEFTGIQPSFSVFAKSASPSLVRWVYGLPEETSEDKAVIYFPGNSERNISYYCINAKEAFQDTTNCTQSNLVTVPFVNLEVDQNNEALWVFADYTFAGIYSQDTDNDIRSWAQKAEVLSESLERQQNFNLNYPNPDTTFPFVSGFIGEDFNGADMPGVLLTEVEPFTIRGDSVPLQKNDVLIEYGGYPVFTMSDVYYSSERHGTSIDKGIGKPVSFKVVRDGMTIEGYTLFFFNEGYYEKSKYGEYLAMYFGGVNSMAWGKGEYVAAGVNWLKKAYNWTVEDSEDFAQVEVEDDKLVMWRHVQMEYLSRQLYPEEFNIANFVGLFISPGGHFLKKPFQKIFLVKVLPKGIISRVASSVIIEVGEGVAWNIMDRSPIESDAQLLRKIREDLKYSVSIGVITGTLGI